MIYRNVSYTESEFRKFIMAHLFLRKKEDAPTALFYNNERMADLTKGDIDGFIDKSKASGVFNINEFIYYFIYSVNDSKWYIHTEWWMIDKMHYIKQLLWESPRFAAKSSIIKNENDYI